MQHAQYSEIQNQSTLVVMQTELVSFETLNRTSENRMMGLLSY